MDLYVSGKHGRILLSQDTVKGVACETIPQGVYASQQQKASDHCVSNDKLQDLTFLWVVSHLPPIAALCYIGQSISFCNSDWSPLI